MQGLNSPIDLQRGLHIRSPRAKQFGNRVLLVEFYVGIGTGVHAIDYVNHCGSLLLWRVIDATAVIAGVAVVHDCRATATVGQ